MAGINLSRGFLLHFKAQRLSRQHAFMFLYIPLRQHPVCLRLLEYVELREPSACLRSLQYRSLCQLSPSSPNPHDTQNRVSPSHLHIFTSPSPENMKSAFTLSNLSIGSPNKPVLCLSGRCQAPSAQSSRRATPTGVVALPLSPVFQAVCSNLLLEDQ